jgi:predicted 3-demethylubiquinone-9 3-methyltransferase (glyoxalase superfamily)
MSAANTNHKQAPPASSGNSSVKRGPRITTNLWFDSQAEEAAKYYTSIFKNSKLGRIARYGKEGHEVHGMKDGTVMTVDFELDGQTFVALNGGPIFKFNEAMSLIVNCDTQDEVDYYWEKLGQGGDPKAHECGWLKDKYGVSWQVVPTIVHEMVAGTDKEKVARMTKVLMQMKKLDIAALTRAYEGK